MKTLSKMSVDSPGQVQETTPTASRMYSNFPENNEKDDI